MSKVNSDDIYICAASRTPMGAFQGALSNIPAPELAAKTISTCLESTGLIETDIEEVYMGNVLSAGLGQAPARQAALKAGLTPSTPCTSVSKVCGSGMKATMLAFDQIKLGANCLIAGGMENMSLAPYLLPDARQGQRLGHGKMLDHMFFDGLQDAYCGRLMGEFADQNSMADNITREEMDAYALSSLERAQQAIAKGHFDAEICPIEYRSGKQTLTLCKDEQPGMALPEKIKQLKPAFGSEGRVTAANASSISDGAASLLLMNGATVLSKGIQPLAKICGHSSFAAEPEKFTHAPIGAINKLTNKLAWELSEVDLFEINEAFAMVTLATMKALNLNHVNVNVNGGASALGHPIGASGARIIVTLLYALKRLNKKRGIASLCIGGGEATAMGIEIC